MNNANKQNQISAMIEALDTLKVQAFDLRSSKTGEDLELKQVQMLLADATELARTALLNWSGCK